MSSNLTVSAKTAIQASPSKVANAELHAALPYVEMPGFMARLRAVEGESAQALRFAILTATRSGEVRGATWREIDFDAKAWTVAAERMKAKKPHRVPLSVAALRLLRARPVGKLDDLIFASSRSAVVRHGDDRDRSALAGRRRAAWTRSRHVQDLGHGVHLFPA